MCDVVEADRDGQRRTSYDKVQGLMKLIEARTDSHMSLGSSASLFWDLGRSFKVCLFFQRMNKQGWAKGEAEAT